MSSSTLGLVVRVVPGLALGLLVSLCGHAQQVVQNGVPIGANPTQSTATVINLPAGGDVVGAVAAVAGAGGGTVNLAAGNYSIAGSINLGSNVTINGAGASTVIYAPPTPNGIAMIAAANGGVSNVIIENLVLDGNIPGGAFYAAVTYGGSGYANSGIYLYGNNNGVSNILVKNVEIRNTGIGILMTVTNAITFNDVYVHDNNPGNFAHNAYLVGCDFVYILHSRFLHAHTGDGLHFDFSASYYLISKSEFSQNHGEGVLDQGGGSINIQDSLFNWNVNDGLNASSTGELLTRSVASYNNGYGFNIQGGEASFDLIGFGDGGGIGFFNYGAGAFGALIDGTTANQYLAILANGVTGATDTADWVTSLSGYQGGTLSGYSQIGAVDFNVNHLGNGLLTFPAVGAVGAGSYTLTWAYSNGTTGALTMPMTVNGKNAGNIVFPPTGGWSTWSTVTVQANLVDGPNVISVSPTAAGAPLLDYLQVNTPVPSAPATPTGIAIEPTGPYATSLTWNSVPGASSYNIYRSSGNTNAGSVIATGVTSPSFADTDILIAASTLSYAVQAVNQGGGSALSASVVTTTPVDAPSGLQASAQGSGNALSWSGANGATSYKVLRASVSGGPYTPLAAVPSPTTSYVDTTATANTTAYYVVQTVNSSGNPSAYSYEVSALTAPPAGTFTLNPAQSTVVLNPGTGTTFGIGVADGAGVSGAVSFASGALPANVNIAFSPTSSPTGTTFVIYVQSTAAPGSYPIAIVGSLGSLSSTTTITLIIPQGQTLSFPAISSQTVGTPLALSATASSGLGVSFVSSTPAVCAVSGTTANFSAAGTCTIVASQAGNASFLAAPSVTQSFNVVAPIPAFSLTPAASTLTLQQNAGGTDAITVTPANGFTGTVSLALSGLPANVSGSVVGTTLIVFPAANAPLGSYPLSITGTSGSTTATTGVTLVITAGASFTLSATPTSAALTAGQSINAALTVTAANGFNAMVSFAATGLPAGVTAAFAPPTGATVSTLSLSATSTVTAGTYPITLTATAPGSAASNGLSQSTTLFLTVNPAQQAQTITFGPLQNQSVGATVPVSASASSGLAVSLTTSTATTCTLSGNATTGYSATAVAAGTCTIVASQTGNAQFAAASPVSQSFTISPGPGFTLSPAASTFTLQQNAGGSDTVNVTPVNGFTGSVSLQVAGLPANVTGSFVGNSLIVFPPLSTPTGSYPLTITGTSGATTASTTITLVITGAANFSVAASPLKLSLTDGQNATESVTVMGSNGFSSSVSFAVTGLPPGVSGAFSPAASASASTLTLSAASTVVAGSYPITITATAPASGNSNAFVQTATITLVIQAAAQTQSISFAAIGTQNVGTTLALSATASSGLPVSFNSATTSVCSVAGNTASLVAPGNCAIVASQGGNASYLAAAPVTQSFTVALRAQTISFGAIAAQQVGVGLNLNASASSGLAVSFASSTPGVCSVTGAAASFLASGTCTLVASQNGNSSYAVASPVTQSFAVAGRAQSIAFAPIASQNVGAALALTATASSGLAVSFSSATPNVCTVAAGIATLVSAGTCTITASQSGNSSYAAAPSASQSFTVVPQTQTITFAAIATQTVGGSASLSASASSGLAVSFASSTTAVCTVSGATATLIAPGSCTIVASQSGNARYAAASPVVQTFSVLAKPSFTLSPKSASLTVTPPTCIFVFCSGGSSATDGITVIAANGFAGTVSLSVSGLPAGVTATFSPTSVAAGAASTLTLTPASTAGTGKSTTLTVSGTAGSGAAALTAATPIKLSY